MRTLAECRAEIDDIDRQLVALFERRMGVARAVAEYKIANDLPVLDASREEQVLQKRREMLASHHWDQAVTTLYQCIMSLSRVEQQSMLQASKEENA